MNGWNQRVHLMDGFTPSGSRVRACCTCGWRTTPRASEKRAETALHSEHGRTPAVCALCGHDFSELGWQQIRRELTILHDDVEDRQFLACRDMPRRCREQAARTQLRLDSDAFAAFGIPMPPPRLRLIRGER